MKFKRDNRMKHIFGLVLLFAASLCLFSHASAQTLEERLNQQTDFLPRNASPVEQLVEISQRFKIPMAIEWVEQTGEQFKPGLVFKRGTILELIRAVVSQSPDHQVISEGRILHVYSTEFVSHPFNFLNLRIEEYRVEDESVFGAEFSLRMAINMTLYPELYKNGYAGGYGGGYPDVFWKKNITFSGEDLTIREILNRIVEESGSALWVVQLNRKEFTGKRPKWVGVPLDDYGSSPLNTRWRFLPLSEERSNQLR